MTKKSVLVVLITVAVLVYPSVVPHASAQVKEVITMKGHPLVMDSSLGTPTARIGEGRLYQMDVTLIEIPSSGELPAHRHLAEEMIYIVAGQGYTLIWNQANGRKERYDWKEGDFLSPTLNSWHQHVNTSRNAPARMLSITSSPLIKNLFKNEALLSSVDYAFAERWERSLVQRPEYVRGVTEGSEVVRMKVGHLLPDLPVREMEARRQDVLGITITPHGDMAQNHIMEMEVRDYRNSEANSPGHRHVWETVYFILDGEGYAMLQRKGEPERRVDWKAGDLFVVEANEYHLHRAAPGRTARFVQVKASGYFHNVGIEDYLMQPGPHPPQ